MCIAFFESRPENHHEHYVLHYHCAHEDCDGLFESHHRFLFESAYEDCSHCLQRDGVVVDPDINPVTYYPPIDNSGIQYVPCKEWVWIAKKADKGVTRKGLATGENGEDNGKDKDNQHISGKSISDVDSVMNYWRKGDLEAPSGSQNSTQHPLPDPNFLVETELEAFSCPSSTFQSPRSPHQNMHGKIPGQTPSIQSSPNTAMHRNLVNEQLAKLPHYIAHAQQRLLPMCRYPAQDYITLQRTSYHWRGSQCYAKGTPSDVGLWYRPEPVPPFQLHVFDGLGVAKDKEIGAFIVREN